MTACLITPFDLNSSNSPTSGVSEVAERLKNKAVETLISLTTNATRKGREAEIIDSLLLLGHECSEQGWDGYDAIPIENNILSAALKYFESLSLEIPVPELSGENDGEVALEWFGRNNATMSISIGKGPDIHYAAIFPDQHKVNGTESIYEQDKGIIEAYIKRVVGNTG